MYCVDENSAMDNNDVAIIYSDGTASSDGEDK